VEVDEPLETHLDVPDDVIDIQALRRIKAEGVGRHQLGIILERPEEGENQSIWLEIHREGTKVGHMTHKAWSYRLRRMIGYALVSVDVKPGDRVTVMREGGPVPGTLTTLPFAL
ncbi:MAG: glycine cleavage T C-terminal barrel domain-containing protein, partial [Pseudomonadota bacterium]